MKAFFFTTEMQQHSDICVDSSVNTIEGSVITFESVNYYVDHQKCCNLCPLPCLRKDRTQILFNLSGVFRPGMNAIMGPTGSGKSSLLDILADRKDRRGLEGEILLDGERQGSDFKYRVGYVVQDDILSGSLTVKENLMFSANVRLSTKFSRAEKNAIVDEVVFQLGLEKCADTIIGNDFKRGVSGGERKRTNIGMELILSPTVLFLDEPTTGLDSSTANNVMEYLHRLSRKGSEFDSQTKRNETKLFCSVQRNDHFLDSSTSLLDLQTIRSDVLGRGWPVYISRASRECLGLFFLDRIPL